MAPLPTLPVTEILPQLAQALEAGRSAVLVAPPGAGKTTLVPLALLDAPWLGSGRIVLLEPRRLAARAAARRMASAARRGAGRNGRLCDAHGKPHVGKDAHHGRHRGRAGAHDPRRSGTARRLGGAVRRVPRTLARRRLRAGAGARRAGRAAARPQASRHVGDARRRARGKTARPDAPVIESAGRSFPVEIRHEERASRHADRGRDGEDDPRGGRDRDRQRARLPARPARDRAHRRAARRPAAGQLRCRPALRPARRQGAGRGDQAARPPAAARWCSPPRSPRPRSPSTACASSSIPACRACRATSRRPA